MKSGIINLEESLLSGGECYSGSSKKLGKYNAGKITLGYRWKRRTKKWQMYM